MATLQTPLCALLGIDAPIVQAPIGSWPELAAAVSNAGGLGMLGLSWDDPSEVRRLIRETSNLTAAPFGMNLKLDEDQHDRLEAGVEEGVRVVSLFWGRLAAEDDYVRMAHQAGALVMLTVGCALEARLAVDAGVDVVVAQGLQAATFGGKCRRWRLCRLSWTPSLQCPSWPPGGSETVEAWPRCWRWGPRLDG